jgi:hypothetical protein
MGMAVLIFALPGDGWLILFRGQLEKIVKRSVLLVFFSFIYNPKAYGNHFFIPQNFPASFPFLSKERREGKYVIITKSFLLDKREWV